MAEKCDLDVAGGFFFQKSAVEVNGNKKRKGCSRLFEG